MGSAAEEKTNGWSEDEADSLLSLVGGWRLDEYGVVNNPLVNGGGINSNPNINGGGGGGVQVNGGGGGPQASCSIHAMPHVCWCDVCSKLLCRVCTQVRLQRLEKKKWII